ncbi:(2Fe-2S) ferredoxin domain-containing protein [Priestia megaterium]|uniref:(2Fe-2S) ferredoxin domain-containing protein n=1 Tax=Priestia megaterium TaxID=1404 RepID=UPI002DBB17CC|nr:(2Fe-2S) ferredoxin domain-containing protein [Priestia megaterium]MEC1071720.1 (2Fe-2S) ferredoxin domain-containing protein [Priestia megaterium]
MSKTKHHVLICNGGSCNQVGVEELTQAIRREISNQDLDEFIHTTRTRCNGRCHDKCVVVAYPNGTWSKDLKPEDTKIFINSLMNEQDETGKVSHLFSNEGFQRTEGIVTGISKEKEKVMKVSKKH